MTCGHLFRGGLVVKAHRLVYHATLGLHLSRICRTKWCAFIFLDKASSSGQNLSLIFRILRTGSTRYYTRCSRKAVGILREGACPGALSAACRRGRASVDWCVIFLSISLCLSLSVSLFFSHFRSLILSILHTLAFSLSLSLDVSMHFSIHLLYMYMYIYMYIHIYI